MLNTTLAVVCGLVLLTFQGLVVAQQRTDQTPPIKASITIDSETLARTKAGIVTITLENISGQEIEFESSCSFNLRSVSKEAMARKHSVVGDSYWGPVNISDGTPLALKIIDPEMQKKGIVVGQVPTPALHFAKNEIKTFKVDLTKLNWNASMLSSWPHEPLFGVVPAGSYSLQFEMQKRGSYVSSNEVRVSVK
jgi:hypothetical protein